MCGIFGQFSNQNFTIKKCIDAVNSLGHRGPDGYGFTYGDAKNQEIVLKHNDPPKNPETFSKFFVGHRRLSVIDLSLKATQPLVDKEKQIVLTFNGEIYNSQELRQQLVEKGYKFKTSHSDSEVLMYAFHQWREDCLNRLIGMFAFAYYDHNAGLVYIARDRYGQKPLYYSADNGTFSFASELKALVSLKKNLSIDIEALNFYLLNGYILHPNTIFNEFQKLLPGYFGVYCIKDNKLKLNKYWNIISRYKFKNNHILALDKVEGLLDNATSLRAVADVPTANFTSGGIDSTIISKYIKNHVGNISSYGAHFPNSVYRSTLYMDEVSNKYDQNLTKINVDSSNIDCAFELLEILDEPFDGASSVALFLLFKKINGKSKVVFTGDGGDEVFAGYDRYIKNNFSKYRAIKIYLILLLKNIIPIKFFKSFYISSLLGYYFQLNTKSDLRCILKSKFKLKNITNNKFLKLTINDILCNNLTKIQALQYYDIKTILPCRMLYKLDIISMNFGIEARSPLLDHSLGEFVFNQSDSFKINKSITKYPLKKLLESDFKENFIHSKKEGFGNPFKDWFSSSKSLILLNDLRDKNNILYNYIDYKLTQKRLPEIFTSYRGKNDKLIWRLIVLSYFLKRFTKQIS